MNIELPPQIAKLTDQELKKRGMTREGFTKRWAERLKLDESSPQVGEPAPDFELELLTPTGKRSGEFSAFYESIAPLERLGRVTSRGGGSARSLRWCLTALRRRWVTRESHRCR